MSLKMRCFEIMGERLNDEGVPTVSSDEQIKVEQSIAAVFNFYNNTKSRQPILHRDTHIAYLKKGLKKLPEGFTCLDASRPWLVYWAVHALELLEAPFTEEEASNIVNFLGNCQNPDGGFGGGPSQYSHLAPTYAAINALAIIGTKQAYDIINRDTMYSFLWRMRTKAGSFCMHEGGEVDIRGVYCAVSVATLLNIASAELFKDTPHWIMRCQTYEGGFSGAPGLEAHGGYTFCGLAALTFLRSAHLCHTQALLRWAVNRQMRFEGGFQGRTNKLVDGCYSFWQGGVFPIIHSLLTQEDTQNVSVERWLFHQEALQEYLLLCCQHPKGGLIDKPGKGPDFYHTCYTLSGLSVAQHFAAGPLNKRYIVGNKDNEVALVHPLYNIGVEAAMAATQHFSKFPLPKHHETIEVDEKIQTVETTHSSDEQHS